MAKTSAGILLYRGEGDSLEVLLVHPGGPFWAKKDEGAWSIPKGELENGEESRACALREMEEEIGSSLGLVPEQLSELGEVRQKSGKVVQGWAVEGDFDPVEPAQQHLRDGVAAALGQGARVPRGRPGRVVRPRAGAVEDQPSPGGLPR